MGKMLFFVGRLEFLFAEHISQLSFFVFHFFLEEFQGGIKNDLATRLIK